MSDSQKFISRNRAPRVQIEYDVELYGAEKKVQLPFVMGVFSDLSGKSEQPPVADRKFLEIDVDNFDERMKAMAPRAQFTVPNTLTGEGSLAVDLTFEKMSDFSPEAIASKVETLAPLLEARRQLSDLMAYMDGKSGAETLIETLLNSPGLLKSLTGEATDQADMDAALESLRSALPDREEEPDTTDATLSALAAAQPADAPAEPGVDDILGGVQRVEEVEKPDDHATALDALRSTPVPEDVPEDDGSGILADLSRAAPEPEDAENESDRVLASMERRETLEEADRTDDVLASVERREAVAEADTTSEVLAGLEAVEDVPEEDNTADVLAGIEAVPDAEPEETSDDVLASLERVETVEEEDRTDDVLASVERREAVADEDTTSEVLAGLEAVEEVAEEDNTADVLASLERVETVEEDDRTDDVLASVERREEATEADTTSEVLAELEAVEEVTEEDNTADVLAGIESVPDAEPEETSDEVLASVERVEDIAETDDTAGILAGLDAVEDAAPEDMTDEVLASLEAVSEAADEGPKAEEVLASIEPADTAAAQDDDLDDILSGLDAPEAQSEAKPDLDNVLSGIEVQEAEEAGEDLDAVLGSLETPAEEPEDQTDLDALLGGLDAPEEENTTDDTAVILAGLETPGETEEATDTGAVLAGLDAPAEPDADTTDLDALLGDLETPEPSEDSGADAADVLAALDPVAEAQEEDSADEVLAGLESPEAEEPEDDLDALLSDLESPATPDEAAAPEADGEGDAGDDLDAMLADLETPETTAEVVSEPTGEPEVEAAGSEAESAEVDLDSLLADLEGPEMAEDAVAEPEASDGADDADDLDTLLADLETSEPAAEAVSELTGEPDAEIAGATGTQADSAEDDLDALLADLEGPDAAEETVQEPETPDVMEDDDLDALLADLETSEAEPQAEPTLEKPGTEADAAAAPEDDLDALLADLEADDAAEDDEEEDDLDRLLADLDATQDTEDEPEDAEDEDDLDVLLADLESPEPEEDGAEAEDDLDALLADLDAGTEENETTPDEPEDETDDLDALLADLEAGEPAEEEQNEPDDDLDSLLAEFGEDAPAAPAAPPQSPFGRISAPRPERSELNRSRFRIAVFGDFTGRASRGIRETGAELAARRAIPLDVDTIEDVIEGFATTLTLPIGKDGAGIEVKLKELDDLHPDELYDNIPIFDELSGLRQQLNMGSMADKAKERLKAWGEAYGTPVRLPRRSASTSVPANLKLSDFQALIGDTGGQLGSAGPIDDLIARIVGPHIVKAPDAGTEAMLAAVDEALSSAMRLVLHHPDFQALESQWRSLDLLARRIETDSTLEIVLYDVSAEELAIDLAAQEDLSESGLYGLLTGVLDPEEGDGGFSALFGLYTFEETPPHAELLARIGQVARHVDAPFFAAITPGFLDIAKEDRHPLVAETWDRLRATPEAAYLGLASPRVLLRLPYGKKSEPCYAFDFEEFTPREGLSGMLWANPAVVVAILLAATYTKDGKAMEPGSVMSLGDMPFHYVTDRYGDQVALPCTERNLTADPVQHTLARGFMPVVSVKGRNEVRLGSFRSLAGTPIAGSWSDGPKGAPTPPGADIQMTIAAGPTDSPTPSAPGPADNAPAPAPEEDDTDLDALLASFDDDDSAGGDDDDEMDPELAALLEGL